MRNRGIEIFLLPLQDEATAAVQQRQQQQGKQQHEQHAELEQVLSLAGVPGTALPAAMAAAHAAVAEHAAQRHRRPPGLRQLRRWAALAAALAGRGWPFGAALLAAWRQLYVRADAAAAAGAEEAAAVAAAAFEAYLQPLLEGSEDEGSSSTGITADLVLYRPAAWPLPLGVSAFAADSAAACASRDVAVLLQQLALLAATELQQQGSSLGSSGGAADALGSREAWVHELGMAAAAAIPAAALVRLLTGHDGASSGVASSGSNSSSSSSDAALLRAPAAARVFAEHCGAGQRSQRVALTTLLCGQLQRLLAAAGIGSGQALLAAEQAEQLVSGMLSHPLAAAAADLQQQLALAVQLPGMARSFLPLDAAAAQQLWPFLLAAGLHPTAHASSSDDSSDGGGSSSGGELFLLWQRVQEVSSKVAALWHAVQAAVVLQSAAAAADGAVASGSATLLQLSRWRHQRPKVRGASVPQPACNLRAANICLLSPRAASLFDQ